MINEKKLPGVRSLGSIGLPESLISSSSRKLSMWDHSADLPC